MKELLDALNADFELKELGAGEFSHIKVSGMKFTINRYHAKGLGNVSIMEAKGFFGLMKMDTFVINATECDMPLFSYDRVYAMGNDTLMLELFDTMLEGCDMSGMKKVKKDYSHIPEHDMGKHWYDDIKLKESLAKKGKKKETPIYHQIKNEYFAEYIKAAKAAPHCDIKKKKEKASVYVEGLLSNGGPAASVFIKNYGAEKTAAFFREVLFGTK